jgi:hypothetical protein
MEIYFLCVSFQCGDNLLKWPKKCPTGAQKNWPEYEQGEHRVLTSRLRSQKQMSPKTSGLNISLGNVAFRVSSISGQHSRPSPQILIPVLYTDFETRIE